MLHGQPGLGSDWEHVIRRLPGALRCWAPDRPGYGSSTLAPGGFAHNASAILAGLDARGVERAVFVGHSYGGGVALTVAASAPHRVEALVLLATVGPGCLNGWDWLLAAPGAGPVCSLVAWRLTPWVARARLRRLARRNGADFAMHQFVNTYVWGYARSEFRPLWRTFLTEQRALVHEADDLAAMAPSIGVPVLLLADPQDTMVPVSTARTLRRLLPDSALSLLNGPGHHLPLRAPDLVAAEIAVFIESLGAAGHGVADHGPIGQLPGPT